MTLADRTVMVVEDDDFQRRTMLGMLGSLGVGSLLEAADGKAAIALLADTRPDIVICDLDMPEMDGVELIRHLAERGPDIALVIASGLDDALLQAAQSTAGAYGVHVLGALSKPLTVQELLTILALYEPATEVEPPVNGASRSHMLAEALRAGLLQTWVAPQLELATGALAGARATLPCTLGGVHGDAIAALGSEPAPGPLARALTDRSLSGAADACAGLAAAGLDVAIVVDLPAAALTDVTLPDGLAELVRESGVEPDRLTLGISAPAVDRILAEGLDVLTRLRIKGFGLALTGFGSGRSGREEIAQLPFTQARIDRELVAAAVAAPDQAMVLEARVSAARELGLVVVAEGCDSDAAQELLRELGCERAEGSVVGAAVALDDVASWATRWSAAPQA